MTRGFGYTAFVVDAYAGVIAGWECSLVKDTGFVERALRHAVAFRIRKGQPLHDAIHHSDAGSQGGFNWSSQHLDQEVCGWDGQEGGRQQRQEGLR
jgi:transposase InsO family protein